MRFSMLLYLLYLILKYYPFFNKSLKETLRQQNCSLIIAENKSDISRAYRFKNGRVTTTRRAEAEPDITLSWSDAMSGMRYMMNPSPKSIASAITRGHLSLNGDARYFSWFLSIIRELPF